MTAEGKGEAGHATSDSFVRRLATPPRAPTIAEKGRFLVIVKTYPSPSTKYGETVCCAGIDAETGGWIRMFPVNFRSLDEFARFSGDPAPVQLLYDGMTCATALSR